MEFEKVFPELCTFGRYQKLIYFFVLLPIQLSYYCHLFSHLFIAYQPPHWCQQEHQLAQRSNATSPVTFPVRNVSQFANSFISMNTSSLFFGQSQRTNEILHRFLNIPSRHVVESVKSSESGLLNMSQVVQNVKFSLVDYVDTFSSCSVYNASYEELTKFHQRFLWLFSQLSSFHGKSDSSLHLSSAVVIPSPPIANCHNWKFNQTWLGADQSIVTKWNLVCHQEWFQMVPLSVFLLGLFVGFPLYYLLSHSLGNRRTYFLMLLCQCFAGTLSAFVNDLKHFSLLRFIIGLSLASTVLEPTDLMVETSGVRVMAEVAFYNESVRLLGALLCALVAYFIHDYRHLTVATSLPFIVFAFFWWSFPESPNYLLVNGQIERLEKYILDIAHTNLGFIDLDFDESIRRRIYTELAIYREFKITSLMNDSFGGLAKYIHVNDNDFNLTVAPETTLKMNHFSPLSTESNLHNGCNGTIALQESTLVEKLAQHLDNKEQRNGGKLSTKPANGTATTPPEIWSEPESDNEGTVSRASVLANGKGNGHLPSHQLAKTQHPSNNSSPGSACVVTPNGLSNGNISTVLKCAFKEKTTLSSVLRLPNMRRKLVVLIFLSMTHFSLYIFFTYFIVDFIGNQLDRRPHTSAMPHSLFHLFTFAIALNLVAILLTWLCLRFKFGRKTTFLSANLLASLFTLLTGIFLGSPPLESVISSSKHDLSHLEVLKQQVNVTLVFYSLAKIFQASTYLVLLIWLYELLPPIADCSVALRACFTLANFQLAFMPFLLYAAEKSLKLSIYIPGVLAEMLQRTSPVGIPIHYLVCVLLLSLSGLLCLILPETGSTERLPYSLQEAERFSAFLGSAASSTCAAQQTAKWYSLKVLFSFRAPKIGPVSGILKKPQIPLKPNGKLWSGKKNFLFDSSLEEKLASMRKDCANQTALNSVYNQFLGAGSSVSPEFELPYERTGSHSESNERNQSAPWMSAVADAAATGMPLFMPAPDPSHTATGKAAFSKATMRHSVLLEEHSRLNLNTHQQQHQSSHQSFSATPSHKVSSMLASSRRHSMHHSASVPTDGDHYQHSQSHQLQPQQHSSSPLSGHSSNIKDIKEFKTGSNAELAYMATFMDLPYHQHRVHSLPRVHPLPPLEVWDDDFQGIDEAQLTQWLSRPATPSAIASTENQPKGAVRVLDIVDMNRGVNSGQVDAYLEHGSSYFSTSASENSFSGIPNGLSHFAIDDDVNLADAHDLSHSIEIDTNCVAYIPLDI